jgi:hypothetical protein
MNMKKPKKPPKQKPAYETNKQSPEKLVLNSNEMEKLLFDLKVRFTYMTLALSSNVPYELVVLCEMLDEDPDITHSSSFGMINN